MATRFITLGINIEREQCYILACSPSRKEGQMKGVQRLGLEGTYYDFHETFAFDDSMGDKVADWLEEHELSPDLILRMVQELGRILLEML